MAKRRMTLLTFLLLVFLISIGVSGEAGTEAKATNEAEVKSNGENIAATPALDVAAVRNYADSMAEDLLLAMNKDDYKQYAEHFDAQMRKAIPAEVFSAANLQIKARIGKYVAKEFVSAVPQEQYVVVIYKAKFSEEEDGVRVKCVFSEGNGKHYISGLWLDSQRLNNNGII